MKFNIQQENGILKYATEEEVKVALNVPDLNDLKTIGGESIIGTGDIPAMSKTESNVVDIPNWSITADPNQITPEQGNTDFKIYIHHEADEDNVGKYYIDGLGIGSGLQKTVIRAGGIAGLAPPLGSFGLNSGSVHGATSNKNWYLSGDGLILSGSDQRFNLLRPVTGNFSEVYFPLTDGVTKRTLALSVNGTYADANGNITVPSGATSLQALTTGVGNNTTNNALLLRGVGQLDVSVDGGVLGYDTANKALNLISVVNGTPHSVVLGKHPTENYAIFGSASVAMTGKSAIQPDEFVTKSQLDANKSLQAVTTGLGNNTTSNALNITGGLSTDLVKEGLNMASVVISGNKAGYISFVDELMLGSIAMTVDGFQFAGKSTTVTLKEETPTVSGMEVNSRVKGSPAISSDEFVTKAQSVRTLTVITDGSLTPYKTALNTKFPNATKGDRYCNNGGVTTGDYKIMVECLGGGEWWVTIQDAVDIPVIGLAVDV